MRSMLKELGIKARNLEEEYLKTDISETSKLVELYQKECDIYLEFKIIMCSDKYIQRIVNSVDSFKHEYESEWIK